MYSFTYIYSYHFAIHHLQQQQTPSREDVPVESCYRHRLAFVCLRHVQLHLISLPCHHLQHVAVIFFIHLKPTSAKHNRSAVRPATSNQCCSYLYLTTIYENESAASISLLKVM